MDPIDLHRNTIEVIGVHQLYGFRHSSKYNFEVNHNPLKKSINCLVNHTLLAYHGVPKGGFQSDDIEQQLLVLQRTFQ